MTLKNIWKLCFGAKLHSKCLDCVYIHLACRKIEELYGVRPENDGPCVETRCNSWSLSNNLAYRIVHYKIGWKTANMNKTHSLYNLKKKKTNDWSSSASHCIIFGVNKFSKPKSSLCQSQWSRSLRRSSAAARLLRLRVRIPAGTYKFFCCECCVLSGRGLCDELIIRPEESYRLWCVVVCVI